MTRPPLPASSLSAARGDTPCDLLITGGKVFVPSIRAFVETSLAITGGCVVGWGERQANKVIDVGGAHITPGFIDAHMHLESTKLWVDEFVSMVLPRGTTAVAGDPHELANVFGVEGINALKACAQTLPFTFGICASSCVPASQFESSGAELDSTDVAALLNEGAIGVAEVMNFPGVILGDAEMAARIAAAGHKRLDGHAPGITGPWLDAYLSAGVESDHECFTLAEAVEKRRKGMWVFIREGSASKNLNELIPMVLDEGSDLTAFCTDDREPDLIEVDGHINDCVRKAVAKGVPIETALLMATWNPAVYHGFHHLGALGPGYQADLLVFDAIETFEPSMVFQNGVLVAQNGVLVEGVIQDCPAPEWMHNSIRLDTSPSAAQLTIVEPASRQARVIGVTPGVLTTQSLIINIDDQNVDLCRIGVIERHKKTGRIGLGYVSGFGLTRGAFASTVAHDAHNVMVVGSRGEQGPSDMAACIARLTEIGGGQVIVLDGKVIGELHLPIAGLMSPKRGHEVAQELHKLTAIGAELGMKIDSPFMQLSFLGLSVIPHLRITDKGIVDTDAFKLVDVDALV